jgi:hypothetical protein
MKPRSTEVLGLPVASRCVDDEHGPEQCDQGSHRQLAGRPTATHDDESDRHDRPGNLRQGERAERALPPERRAQHRHQLDVASPHAAPAHDGDQEDNPAAHQHAETGFDHGGTSPGHDGESQRVDQPGEGDHIGNQASAQVEDHHQGQRAEQRQKLPPARDDTESSNGQQREGEGQTRAAGERDRREELDEPTPYFVDGDPVEAGAWIRRGAG